MNRKLTYGLLAVFAVLVVYLLVVQRPKDLVADITPTARVTTYVWTTTADQITGFRVDDKVNAKSVAVTSDGAGGWTLTEPGPQPAEPTAVTQAVSTFAALTVAATVTSTTDMTLFGVLSPTYTIDVTLVDGTHLTAAVGDKTPTGTAYYVLPGGQPYVVTVASAFIDPVLTLVANPPIMPPTAMPTVAITGTVAVTGTAGAEGTPAGTPAVTPDLTATP